MISVYFELKLGLVHPDNVTYEDIKCEHGGAPWGFDPNCYCICPEGYTGFYCQNHPGKFIFTQLNLKKNNKIVFALCCKMFFNCECTKNLKSNLQWYLKKKIVFLRYLWF